MKMTHSKKMLSLILCLVLVAAMTLFSSGCSGKNQSDTLVFTETEDKVLGTGAVKFTLVAVDAEDNKVNFQISTDKATVGEALLELGIIEGEESQYGLFVKTVNGLTVDFDKHKMYWAFYINGAYATSGVSETQIEAGATYTYKAEK